MRVSSALIVTILSVALGISARPADADDFHFSVDSSTQFSTFVSSPISINSDFYPFWNGYRLQAQIDVPTLDSIGFIKGFSFPLGPGDKITSATLKLDLTRSGSGYFNIWFSPGSPLDPHEESYRPELFESYPSYEAYGVPGSPLCELLNGCSPIFDISNLLRVQGSRVQFDGATVNLYDEFRVIVWDGYNWTGDVFEDFSFNEPYSLELDGTYIANPAATPEPATLCLLGTALLGLAAKFKLHKRSAQS